MWPINLCLTILIIMARQCHGQDDDDDDGSIFSFSENAMEHLEKMFMLEEEYRLGEVDRTKCICYVPQPGIYNGLDLNRYLHPHTPCGMNLYICDRKRLMQPPLLLFDCSKDVGCYYQKQLHNCSCKSEQILMKKIDCGHRIRKSKCFRELRYECNNVKPDLIGMC